jgi:PAS domain S-box-containing protein
MPILVNRIRWLSFFAVFCLAWFNVVVGVPLEAISFLKKTVLVLHGDQLSSRAAKTTERGLMILVGTSAAGQTPVPRQRVLVLYSDERLLPANIIMDEAIRAAFAAGTKNPIEFYSEFLDVARFPGEEQQQRQVDFFRDKYRALPPDLVIAVSGGALVFLTNHRVELFAGVPIVYCSVTGDPHPDSLSDARIAEVTVPDVVAPTLEMMLRLHPDTRQVAVVSGSGPRDRQFADVCRQKMSIFGNRVAFNWLTNLSMEQLRGELSRLPDHTVVLYLNVFRDAAGKAFTPRQALDEFAPASRAPIYGFYDTYLGHGIVGGSMVTFEEIGRKAAQLGVRILAGEDAQAAARSEPHQAVPMFDWRQLRRWNISEQRLPPGSIVQFKEATFWEQHYRIIVTAFSLCLLQTLLIVALLLQLRRRRLAEAALRESEQGLSLAASAAHFGIWIRYLERDEIWATDKWRELFGFGKSERLDVNCVLQRLHPEDREAVSKTLAKALSSEGTYETEYRVVLPDGRMRWIASRGGVEFDANGKPALMRGAALDITTRKQAEEAAHDLSGRLIQAQEEGQMRVARDLHDDFSQSLALLSIELDMFGQIQPAEPGQITERMREFSAQVKRLSLEVHRLSHELHPATLEQLGLVAALSGFCEEFALAHKLAIEFTDGLVPRAVPEDTALCLYRIAQEALYNVVKHSRATAARVELVMDGGELRLTIDDDGVGFDPKARHANASLGLVSMSERARFVHGLLSVESHAGKGTRVEVRVPIDGADDLS